MMTFFTSFRAEKNKRGGTGTGKAIKIFTFQWLHTLQSVFVHGFLSHTRGTHCTKTAYKHRPQVRKRTITRKSELLAPWQGLQSTVHTNKTGNKTDRKRHVPQLAERVHSLLYQTRMLLTLVLPGVSSTKRRAKERGTGTLPCGCVCLATTHIAVAYPGFASQKVCACA